MTPQNSSLLLQPPQLPHSNFLSNQNNRTLWAWCEHDNIVESISLPSTYLKFSILLNVQNGSDSMCYLCSPTFFLLNNFGIIFVMHYQPLLIEYQNFRFDSPYCITVIELMGYLGSFFFFFFFSLFFFSFLLLSLSMHQPWHSFLVKVYIVISI